MIKSIDLWDKNTVIKLTGYFSEHFPSYLIKFFSEYLIYSVPLLLLILWFLNKDSKKVALRAFFSIILAWPVIANIIGHLIYRPRPFEVTGVKELVFHRPDYSFPSDHASALFALAFSLWFSGYKKLSLSFLIIAVLITFFRIAGGIHYPTDILAGAVIGLAASYIVFRLEKILDIVYNFIISVFSFLKLS